MNEILQSAMKEATDFIENREREIADMRQALDDCDNQLSVLMDNLKKIENEGSFEEFKALKKEIAERHEYRVRLIKSMREKCIASDDDRDIRDRLYGAIGIGMTEEVEVTARAFADVAEKYIKLFEDAMAEQEKAVEVLDALSVALDIPCANGISNIQYHQSLYSIYTGFKTLLERREKGRIA